MPATRLTSPTSHRTASIRTMSAVRGRTPLPMCDDDGVYASGWDVMIETRRVQHRFEVAMDQSLEAYGISYAQYRALELIVNSHPMHVSELARRLRLSRQTVLTTVEKLARCDLVALEREPNATYVALSPAGRRGIERIRRFTLDLPGALDTHLTAAQRRQLVALLRRADRTLRPPRRPTWWLAP
jgi:DNA-binding MarR family transcriptional regulator